MSNVESRRHPEAVRRQERVTIRSVRQIHGGWLCTLIAQWDRGAVLVAFAWDGVSKDARRVDESGRLYPGIAITARNAAKDAIREHIARLKATSST